MRRVGLVIAVVSLLFVGAPGPVAAAATHSHEDFNFSSDTCGVPTDVQMDNDLVFVRFMPETGFPAVINIHDRFLYTNALNGHTATWDWFGKLTQTFVSQDPETGNLTILQTYYGLESRIKAGDGRTLGIDAGQLTLSTVWDPTGSMEFSMDLVTMKGPHPLVVSDTAFCDAMLSVLS